jgi:hypothetical protein
MQQKIPRNIIILGGGTAGWMAANLMSKLLGKHGVRIKLIASDSVATIGVGEGSTPFLKEFFDLLDIPEREWMPASNATYKCGIRFPDWAKNGSYESYFHPFYSDIDGPQAQKFFEKCNLRRNGHPTEVTPDDYFYTTYIANQLKAPKTPNDPGSGITYGYHFDAELLAKFLKSCALRVGVEHLDDVVEGVHLDSQGQVAMLTTASSGLIRGDFFVDCSGFKGLIVQQTLGETLKSFSDYLFCDSAVAIQSPLEQDKIPSETISQALSNGWAWRIPLQNRYGNGYVFSSRYIDAGRAEFELRNYLGLKGSEHKALHLKWTPGRIEQHWKKNCLAVGLSQGFLEPLEAPMLFIIQRTILEFIDNLLAGLTSSEHKELFNNKINTIIDGTRDYLQAHYKVNTRSDSQFWIDCRANQTMSNPLHDILGAWQDLEVFDEVLARHQDKLAYLKTSWYCLLAGKGFYKPLSIETPKKPVDHVAIADMQSFTSVFYDHATFLSTFNNKN